MLFKHDGLAQRSGHLIIDQDFVVFRHHPEPVRPDGKGRGRRPIRQRDPFWQRQWGRCAIQADDKQRHHRYNAANHDDGQYRDQAAQKPQVCRFNRGLDVVQPPVLYDFGKSAVAP